ncbi:MAG: aldo/keto reductase [Lentisphaeria bacterium]|nr:aldo/keto reductase [Lentisphaeria bacterium]NQZ68279.1 aldo/keto reductase [Lentisphaeria bacterium]
MKYARIPGVDKEVSLIVQGTMGGNAEIFDQAYEVGIRALDTAKVYGNEKIIGDWLQASGVREDFVVLTKGAHPDNEGNRRCNPTGITEDLDQSLEKLQTNYIDLFGLHRDNEEVPVSEIIDCLHGLCESGLIHAYGVSNWSCARIQEANDYAKANGKTPFAFSSPNYSLAEQYEVPWADCTTISGPAYKEERAWYQETQLPLFTWSSMASGFLAGLFPEDMFANDPDSIPDVPKRCYCGPSNYQRLARAQELADKKGVALPTIALAFIFSQPLNIFSLVAAQNKSEMLANIETLDLVLTQEELDWLDLKS